MCVVALTSVTVLLLAATAARADTPVPAGPMGGAATVNGDGTVTLSVNGSWIWNSTKGACTPGKAGYAVDWNDADQAGNVVGKVGGNSIAVGAKTANALNPADNAIHAANCGTSVNNHPAGTWGPATHTYAAGIDSATACVVTYHVKGNNNVAGGPGHNKDNSVEENGGKSSATEADVAVIGPSSSSRSGGGDSGSSGGSGSGGSSGDKGGKSGGKGDKGGKGGGGDDKGGKGGGGDDKGGKGGGGDDKGGKGGGGDDKGGGGGDDKGGGGGDDGDHSGGAADMCFTVKLPQSQLSITKVADDASVAAGDDLGFTITVRNTGAGAARSVSMTDDLPAGLAWSLAGTSGSPTCGIAGGKLTCTAATLGANASFSAHVTAPTDANDCGRVTNKASVTSSSRHHGDDDDDSATSSSVSTATATGTHKPPAASASASVIVDCAAVNIAKTADSGAAIAMQRIGYTITVTNAGGGTARNVVAQDTLPNASGLSWSVDHTSGSPTCGISGGVLRCSAASLGSGDSFSAHITSPTTFASCGDIDNTAVLSVSGANGGSADATVRVTCPPAGLHLLKSGPSEAHVGDTVTYSFGASNRASQALHSVVLTDPRCDAAPVLDDGDTNGDNVLQSSEVWSYSCDHVVTAGDADPLPNTATITGLDPNGTSVDSSDSWTVDILHPALTFLKTGSRTSGAGGAAITFTYEVTNTSSDTTLYNVKVTDDLLGPIGTVAQLAPGASKTFDKASTLDSAHKTNIGTATGCDHIGGCVSKTSKWTVTVVLGTQFPPTPLPRTGVESADPLGWAWLLGGVAIAIYLRRARKLEPLA
jgi:uncharacterized repeat protein (TIGR01451 family)